jgi:hypothetical protein
MHGTKLTAATRAILSLAAALAILLVAACGSYSSTPAQGAVPWTDRPGTPEMRLASGAVASRPCVARDVHVDLGRVGAYQGHQTQELFMRNLAPDACFVSVPPAIAAVFGSGQPVPVARGAAMSATGAANGVDGLSAGSKIHILIGTPGTCAGAGTSPKVATIVRISLSGTEVVTVPGTWLNMECGSPVLLAFDLEEKAAPPVPASSLTAKLSVPGPASAGGTLTYFVTLSNSTRTTVVLGPCPSYTESIGVGAPLQQTFLLNCDAVGSIPAGAATTYEMRLAVPASFSKGQTKLSWQLDVSGGAFAGTIITIR